MHYKHIHSKLLTAFPPEQAEVLAQVIHEAYTELVKTSDFNELKEIVRDLGLKMGELAEAQRETQKEVGRLDRALQELAEAQKRTEEALQKLTSEHAETRRQLGGLTATVSYRLKDEAFKALPLLLKRDYGLIMKDRLKRKFVRDNHGINIEINIIGEAEKNGEVLTIIGESKSQLSKKDIDNFIKKKLKRLEGVFSNIFPVLVTYMTSEPDVEKYAKEKGIALYYSYDL